MSIEVFFNRPGQPVPIERLYREIRDARHRLTVASAWFTDTHLADAILDSPAPSKLVLLNAADLGRGDKRAVQIIKRAAAEGEARDTEHYNAMYAAYQCRPGAYSVKHWDRHVEVYTRAHPKPPQLRMVVLGSRDFTQGVMHHKFIAIDDRMVWTGSFNFTFNAQRNYENLIRIDDPDIVQRYHTEADDCARHVWTDDSDGMITCVECRERFYPDEDPDAMDSHGGFMCRKCRATDAVMTLMDVMPDPIKPPPAQPAYPLRQLRAKQKK